MNELASKLRVSYHLDTVQPDHILRRAADEIERLAAERDELSEVRRAIGGGIVAPYRQHVMRVERAANENDRPQSTKDDA